MHFNLQILSGLHNCKDFNEYKACSHDESTAFISICKSQTDVYGQYGMIIFL